ncbi:MAG: hypothetical protein IIV87_04335 [Oscillospiraceae bacterium]|nr:hypothetical protein [Oscillospiraceae bacterium]
MKLKRIAAYVLTVALLLTGMVLSIHAASAFTVSLSEVEVMKGETVTLELSVSNNTDLAALSVRVYYPANVMTCDSADAEVGVWADYLAEGKTALQNANENDTKNISAERAAAGWAMASMSWVTAEEGGMTASGVMGELTFTVDENARAKTYALEVEVVQATDSASVNLADVVVENGAITAKEEHHYIKTEHAPTCDKAGYTDYFCILCGDKYTVPGAAALGHAWDDADCDTPKTCSVCGATEGTALGHNYVNGTCTNCGAEDPNFVLTDAALKTTQQAISLQDYVGMQFIVMKAAVKSYDRAYAVIERNGEQTIVDASLTASYTRFEVPILAAQMSEMVTFTLYGEKDGKLYKGESLTKSVSSLCGEKFAAANDATKKVIVDMLNYGAAVQTQFYPGQAELANANLTDAQKAYGSQANPNMTGSLTESGSGTVVFQQKSLSLQDKVEFSLVLKLASAKKADYEARITLNGATTVIDGADFVTVNANYCRFNLAAKAIDMRDDYTIAIYEKATGNQVSKTLTMDIAGLANSKLGATLDSVIYAMLNYGDSAAALVGK